MSHQPKSPLKSLLWLWQKTLNHNKNQEAGNTLIIAISLGVLLIGATSTMIFTSSRNRTNVTSDEMSVRAQEVGELGVTRVHGFIARNSRLAEYPRALEDVESELWDYDWSTVSTSDITDGVYSNTSTSNKTCSALVASTTSSTETVSDQINSFQNGQAVNPDRLNQGGFELLSYVAQDTNNIPFESFSDLQTARNSVSIGQSYGFGQMIIKASLNPNANSLETLLNNNDPITSQSQIRVNIPLIRPDPSSIKLPGVWISDQSISSPTNSQIDATLLAPSCDNIGLNITPGNDAILSSITFPPLPPEPTDNPNYENLGDLTSSITLPREEDEPTRTEVVNRRGVDYNIKVYEYKVNSISYNGDSALKIIPGNKVILHLHGNISLGGNQTIGNTCTNGSGYTCTTLPEDPDYTEPKDKVVQVVTYNPSGETSLYRNSNLVILGRKQRASGDPVTQPNICLSGGAQIFGFVFAPDYAVGAAGTGSGNGFIGAVWARLFNPPSTCGSNTGQVVAIQEIDDWEMLGMGEDFIPGNLPPRIGTVSQWQREGVN